MSLNRSSKRISYPSQAYCGQVIRADRSQGELLRRCFGPTDWHFSRRAQRESSDLYAAEKLLKKVEVLCTSIPPLQSWFARTHLQEHKTIRGLRLPQWQALTAVHHALLCTELDTYLANIYRARFSIPRYWGFTYRVKIDEFIWPEEFNNMLALLQQQLPKSHCDILERFHGHSLNRMTHDLAKDFAPFFEAWTQRLEYMARYQPGEPLSGGTVLRNDMPKMWYNKVDDRDLNELGNIIYRHKDLGGAILTAFCNATRRDFLFTSMESSLAARTVDSATGEVVRIASDTIRARPSDDPLTPKSLNSICIVESDSEEWDQRRLAHWRQHYGQGRSRTWRYRLYVKAKKRQVTALAVKPRPCYLCVTFGPTPRLPVTVDRPSKTLVTDWKLGKRRRTVIRNHIDEALFSNEAHCSLPRAESNHYETQEFYYPGDEVDYCWPVPSSRHPERPLALPYENFVGAFLAPAYRIRRFLRQENHGEVYTVTHFARPQVDFEAKVYNMKALSRNMYNYRVRDIKRLERHVGYVETIRQGGRRLVICAAVLEAPDGNTQQNPLLCKGTHDYQLAYPPLPKVMTVIFSTDTPKTVVHSADMFYRRKALRIALEAGLRSSNLFCYFPKRSAGSFGHCTTPEGGHAENITKAGSMERKRRRQKKRRLNDKQRGKERAKIS